MTLLIVLALVCVLLLAYGNGANDNFKGVATLFGSGVSDYGGALRWATVCTLLGSIAAVVLAAGIARTFSGKGLIEASLLAEPLFPVAVAGGAALTVLLASRIGAPISTTHSLVGALLGAALIAQAHINWSLAVGAIFAPLVVGPVIAMLLTWLGYPLLHRLRRKLGVERQTCVCVGETWQPLPDGSAVASFTASVDREAVCAQRYQGRVMGVSAQTLLDNLHYGSAGLVSFARGVNDTPKLAGILILATPLAAHWGAFVGIGLVIAIGGLLGARRVAETMAHKITSMNAGQGLTANLVTSVLLLTASPLGLPLSTTQVSVGALFGIGKVTGKAHGRAISGILAAWVITLPMAAGISALSYTALNLMI